MCLCRLAVLIRTCKMGYRLPPALRDFLKDPQVWAAEVFVTAAPVCLHTIAQQLLGTPSHMHTSGLKAMAVRTRSSVCASALAFGLALNISYQVLPP